MKTSNFDEIRDEIKQMREDAAKGIKCSPASAFICLLSKR